MKHTRMMGCPDYSQSRCDGFQGSYRSLWPSDVNWYDEIFKKSAFQENVNVDVSGGSKRLKYFVSAGYFTQDGMVKDFGTKDSGVNSNYFTVVSIIVLILTLL